MINILTGGKTGFNLFKYLKKLDIPANLYYTEGEFSQSKRVGSPLAPAIFHNKASRFIITSETGFHIIPDEYRASFTSHYFLRDKANLPEIARLINCRSIEEVSVDSDISFPIIAKPAESGLGLVPFKFKVISSLTELASIAKNIPYCILQPYLDPSQYTQIAVAGYFDGSASSLICVEQVSHYPKGISAFVVDITSEYNDIICDIVNYLNQLNFKGFVEFEFKKSKNQPILFLMDINPRPWGWFYFYLSRVSNFEDVLINGSRVELTDKKAWINPPRLVMAILKGQVKLPSVKWLFSNGIVYEPLI